MNKKIGVVSACFHICTVTGFSLCLLFGFFFGAYLFSVLIAFSLVPMICAFAERGNPNTTIAGHPAMAFAGVYAALIFLIYFTRVTTVQIESLGEQTRVLFDDGGLGLSSNLSLLGHGMIALGAFFAGLMMAVKTKSDALLKYLLVFHGIFAVSGLLVPMLGLFRTTEGAPWMGPLLLAFWCAYFIPVGVLAFTRLRRISG